MPSPASPPNSYETAYFQLTAADVFDEAEDKPFDIVIIGSGIGGGVLAASLLEKNRFLTESIFNGKSTTGTIRIPTRGPVDSTPKLPEPLRILVVERGGLLFHTHCLNGPRPSNSGTTSQGNDFFFQTFKHKFDIVDKTQEGWAGGPVYCVGGRAAVWGLFSPRIDIKTLESRFPQEVHDDLLGEYYPKAEKMVKLAYPSTLPQHQALIDRLNLRTNDLLPFTQWQWGRVASEFRNPRNFDFAEGAFSTIDTLLEAAMNDPDGQRVKYFRQVPNVFVGRLEPIPQPDQQADVTHVVIKDLKNEGQEYKIACKQAVICAGSVESPAILLRSVDGDLSKFGDHHFSDNFGHVTDHRILAVSSPFFYLNMEDRDVIGGMKLQTDIQFNIQRDGQTVDGSTALVNISLDGSSFLPRTDDTDTGDLPVLIIAYIIPSELASSNTIELEDKKQVLKEFAVDVMNKVVETFDVRFAKTSDDGYTPILHGITLDDITLATPGPGIVAHELGSIPMPDKGGAGGILNSDLALQYGWKNVSVCDLSVFPYSAAANPTLTLAALALRLSDKLFEDLKYAPVKVYNLTDSDVIISITNSRPAQGSFGPEFPTMIPSGQNETWKIAQREVMTIYSEPDAESYDVQMVYPGIDAMIVTPPPIVVRVPGCIRADA